MGISIIYLILHILTSFYLDTEILQTASPLHQTTRQLRSLIFGFMEWIVPIEGAV